MGHLVVPLTLPILNSSSPFALSPAEAALPGYQWAWLFLRLNPRYRHDWTLLQDAEQVRAGAREGDKIADHSGSVLREILELDCRLFSLGGRPIEGEDLLDILYRPRCLGTAIESERLDVQHIRWREFEAATEHGISGWVDPEQVNLPPLGEGENWFYLSVEPVWQTRSQAYRSGTAKKHTTNEGRTFLVGSHPPAMKAATQRGSGSTEMDFLVCLDGDLGTQLTRARDIAMELHRLAAAPLLRNPAAYGFPKVMDAEAAQNRGHVNLLARVLSVPSVQGLRWRQVVIDFAASIGEQFSDLKQLLEDEKSADLAVKSRRRREGRRTTPDGDWLKRSLAAVEYLRGYLAAGLSQNDAITALANEAEANSELGGDLEGRLREALHVGRDLVAGTYRFLIDYRSDKNRA